MWRRMQALTRNFMVWRSLHWAFWEASSINSSHKEVETFQMTKLLEFFFICVAKRRWMSRYSDFLKSRFLFSEFFRLFKCNWFGTLLLKERSHFCHHFSSWKWSAWWSTSMKGSLAIESLLKFDIFAFLHAGNFANFCQVVTCWRTFEMVQLLPALLRHSVVFQIVWIGPCCYIILSS